MTLTRKGKKDANEKVLAGIELQRRLKWFKMVDKGKKLSVFTDSTSLWCPLDNVSRWKVLTWESDSSHGRDNVVVTQDCNYADQKIRFLYYVIRRITLLQIFFDDIAACDLSKEKTLWTKTVPLQSAPDE